MLSKCFQYSDIAGHLDSFGESSLHPSSTEHSTVLGVQMLSEQSLSQLQDMLITQTCSPAAEQGDLEGDRRP